MDLNSTAFRVVQAATSEARKRSDLLRVKAGRAGGLRGGPERANVLSPERRREIAVKASRARWMPEGEAKSISLPYLE